MRSFNCENAQIFVVYITQIIDSVSFSKIVAANVYGYFSRDASPIELEKLISSFDKYNCYSELKLDSRAIEQIRKSKSKEGPEGISFTKRELEVLNLVCQEQTNTEISEVLGLSIRTIETFRRNMILKSDCKNMIGVILKAIQLKRLKLNT